MDTGKLGEDDKKGSLNFSNLKPRVSGVFHIPKTTTKWL